MADRILSGLFESPVATVEVDLYRDAIGELTAPEAAALPRAHPDRLLEYRAGRHCARQALAQLGAPDATILRAGDRSPIWPHGFIGSITHTRGRKQGWCAAAVVRSLDARGIGLDAELDEPLEEKLWERVLLREEQSFVSSQGQESGFWAKLIFSAKEATYKCQFPLTKQFLEFSDVRVALSPADESFCATLVCDAGTLQRGSEFRGRYTRRHGVIATAVLLR